MTDRKPYVTDADMKELHGLLKFARKPYESLRKPKPQPPAGIIPVHAYDEAGTKVGLSGYELQAMTEGVLEVAHLHPMLQDKLLDLVMTAKMIYTDEICEHQAKGRQRKEREEAEKIRRDKTYQTRLKEWDQNATRLETDWEKVTERVKVRWRRRVKSLVSLVKKNNDLDQMVDTDRILLEQLAFKTSKVEIRGDQVIWVNSEGLLDMSVAEVAELMDDLIKIYTSPEHLS